MTSFKELQNKAECVILSIGDIIVDSIGGHIGILTKKSRHIDIIEDDIYVWEVKWINNVVKQYYEHVPVNTLLEEESLKCSIVLGTYEWHSIDGESYEL